jgi:phage/plasmid-associated DNA primase
MDGDQELINFMQRALGYSLTGDTSERVIFIESGTGANGIIGDFIDGMCVLGENIMGTAKELYENYETWCDTEGEKVISKKLFGMKLRERGFDSYKATGGVRTWIGIGINPE